MIQTMMKRFRGTIKFVAESLYCGAVIVAVLVMFLGVAGMISGFNMIWYLLNPHIGIFESITAFLSRPVPRAFLAVGVVMVICDLCFRLTRRYAKDGVT